MVIGWKWKCSNTCSGPVLIGRGLEQATKELVLVIEAFILCIFECTKYTYNVGDNEEGGTPVPMPNTEVKPFVAEDTLESSLGKNTKLPTFFIFLNSSVVEHSAVNRRVVGSSPT